MKTRVFMFRSVIPFLLLYGILGASVLTARSAQSGQEFIKSERAWRERRAQEMRSPESWLTIAGLFWLAEGENGFGSAPTNKVRLPEGAAPDFCGRFVLKSGKVRVIVDHGAPVKAGGLSVTQMDLKGDDSGKPDILELGDLRLWVIKRIDRFGIRFRDLNASALKEFKGLDYFPPDPKYVLTADLIRYPAPRKVAVPTVIGIETEMTVIGELAFKMDGRDFRFQAFIEDPDGRRLLIVFGDATNGVETYEASRFLDATILENGKVALNFNRAYNPPCAFSSFAACPLPPRSNRLPFRLEAGEKKYAETGRD